MYVDPKTITPACIRCILNAVEVAKRAQAKQEARESRAAAEGRKAA